MDRKIEQVKEVLNRHCHFCKQDKCDSNENISKEINALYSEPQVGGVPATLPPDELLTDEEIERQIIGLEDKGIVYCCQVVLGYYNLKCHQSEAAEIAGLQADIEELNILSRGNSEVYEAKLKELEDKLHEQEDGFAVTCMNCQSEARADQNKKIGEWLDTHKAYYLALVEAVAKLQKGEF